MPVPKPTNSVYHRRRDTTTLHFLDDKGKAYSNEFVIRGGVCWPMSIWKGNREAIEGYAVVVGKNIRNGMHTIFMESEILAIDHVTDSDGRIKYRGLAPWLNDAWSIYFCKWFHWHGRTGTVDHWMRDIRRSAMVQPKPRFSECIWDADVEIDHQLALLAMHEKLRADKDGGFVEQLDAYQTNQGVPYPALIAAKACIAGFHQHPWNRKDADYD